MHFHLNLPFKSLSFLLLVGLTLIFIKPSGPIFSLTPSLHGAHTHYETFILKVVCELRAKKCTQKCVTEVTVRFGCALKIRTTHQSVLFTFFEKFTRCHPFHRYHKKMSFEVFVSLFCGKLSK